MLAADAAEYGVPWSLPASVCATCASVMLCIFNGSRMHSHNQAANLVISPSAPKHVDKEAELWTVLAYHACCKDVPAWRL